MNQSLILLPQTALRFWGIPEFKLTEVVQVELPLRLKNDELFAQYYYLMNEMIFAVSGHSKVSKIKTTDLEVPSNTDTLIDMHILNLLIHFPATREPKGLVVVNYSSLGNFSLTKADIRLKKYVLRYLKQNLELRKKYEPKCLWHWDDFAKNNSHQLIKFGWQQKFVEFSNIESNSKIFIIKYKNEFEELTNLNTDDKILIIAPDPNFSIQNLELSLNKLMSKNSVLKSHFDNCIQILIKQHRVCENELPLVLELSGKKCRVGRSPLFRVLPIEILIHAFPNSLLVSAKSSALFGTINKSRSIVLSDEPDDYKVMMNRYNKQK